MVIAANDERSSRPGPRSEVSRVDIDLGDVTVRVVAIVHGLRRFKVRWHVGVPFDTTPADRTVHPRPGTTPTTPRKVDLTMDLKADNRVPLSVEWTDEVGNPVDTPDDATATYAVDDPNVINLTDNGDGTATAAATGLLGTANVHGEFTAAGTTVTGDLQIVVVAGLAERANIVAGAPEEVTPDE
jgi:hypothetical protein